MSSDEHRFLALRDFDVDGAVRETFSRLPGHTRAGFLSRAAGVGAGVAGALALRGSAASAQGAPSGDVAILNYALSLEYLQAAFYTEAEQMGALHGALTHQAHVVGAHERAHVKAFKGVLGSAAIKQPNFNFHGVTSNPDAFRSTAVAFEDLATAAYKGQAPNLRSRTFLAAAIAIHSVEARHAAWIRRLAGFLPAAKAFDDPLDAARVIGIVNSTHFVTLQVPTTSARSSPGFTG